MENKEISNDILERNNLNEELLYRLDVENIVETTVPIPAEKIKEYFLNKDLVFFIDVEGSKLKGNVLLTYLSNIDVPCDIIIKDDISQDTYNELMLAYLNQKMVLRSKSLTWLAGQLLLAARGIPFEEIPITTNIDSEWVYGFLINNQELVFRWLNFIDSSVVYCLEIIPRFKEINRPDKTFELIDDKDFVGLNVVNLYNLPLFMQSYFSLESQMYKLNYFKPQFEEYMFGGKKLFEYFSSDFNLLLHLFEGFDGKVFDLDNYREFFKIPEELINEEGKKVR